MNDDSQDRHKITFAQAEGREPLPQPLALGEISQKLRALLWNVFWGSLVKSMHTRRTMRPTTIVVEPWDSILRFKHIVVDHGMADDFTVNFDHHRNSIRRIFEYGDYIEILEFVQMVLRHPSCPYDLKEPVATVLKSSKAAYRVVDGKTIMPVASQQEGAAIEQAFVDLDANELNGARAHLRKAGEMINHGHFADSVHESINAVEAVARTLDPDANTLAPALKKLEKSTKIHPALKQGFEKIYGYTSDNEGIRHALVDKAKAEVDQHDAVFMLGACASFITYLVGKAVEAEIPLKKRD